MKIEEVIKQLESIADHTRSMAASPDADEIWKEDSDALEFAISALRPVSREQVEKSWAGCEYCEKHKINLVRIEMNCNDSPGSPKRLNPTRVPKFCPMCGRPLTDEAVQMVMERLEALKDDKED